MITIIIIPTILIMAIIQKSETIKTWIPIPTPPTAVTTTQITILNNITTKSRTMTTTIPP